MTDVSTSLGDEVLCETHDGAGDGNRDGQHGQSRQCSKQVAWGTKAAAQSTIKAAAERHYPIMSHQRTGGVERASGDGAAAATQLPAHANPQNISQSHHYIG